MNRDPKTVLDYCNALLESEQKLSEWERVFVLNMQALAARGMGLTTLQNDKLEEIIRAVDVPRGLTISEEDLWK